jgi:3-hydroxy acid dehydrogenase/malonic semialdehyde reductase
MLNSTQLLTTIQNHRYQFSNKSYHSPKIIQQKTMSSNSKRLEGKTVLITGASSGIGRSTALEFARTTHHNLKLILTARRIDRLKQLAGEITTEYPGVKVHPVQLDVSNPAEVQGLVGSLPEEFKNVDVLVNNAYVLPSVTAR